MDFWEKMLAVVIILVAIGLLCGWWVRVRRTRPSNNTISGVDDVNHIETQDDPHLLDK